MWIPREELPSGLEADDEAGATVTVSDIIDHFASEVRSDVESEDHRSHYDLGMAYLEMELLPEAIREFQLAAQSGTYRVRCLEMVGLCFLRQNQPRLAIKQLELGLQLVNQGERESLGLQYNLGLAYEMIGEFERAKACFETVYVVDVGFRDVSTKFQKYSS